MTQQVSNTPVNPLIALATLPQPQVISGTLGEQGSPVAYTDLRQFPSIMDANLINNTDFLGTANITTANNTGTRIFSCQTPLMGRTLGTLEYDVEAPMNWNHLPMLTHQFWDVKQQIGFVFVGPQAITGKLLITYDPIDLASGNILGTYRADRRKITTEWDLSKEKMKWIEVEGFKMDEKRSIYESRFDGWANPNGGYAVPTKARNYSVNLGSITLTLIQRIQKVSIFPESYSILVFGANAGSTFYTPTDPRRQFPDLVTPYYNDTNAFYNE
jgi:hypothetical protein